LLPQVELADLLGVDLLVPVGVPSLKLRQKLAKVAGQFLLLGAGSFLRIDL